MNEMSNSRRSSSLSPSKINRGAVSSPQIVKKKEKLTKQF